MSLIPPLLAVLVFMSAVMALGWAWQKRTGNGGWIDVFWTFGTGIAGVAIALFAAGDGPPNLRRWMVAALVAIWSIRLGSYIAVRVARGGKAKEDVRYARLKAEWGSGYQGRMFWFMQLQAPATMLLCLAILLAAGKPGDGLGPGDILGAALLAIAILGEGLADRQMAAFRANPSNKGQVCDTGLWGLSRHPNYVFEWLGWVAYPVIAFQVHGSPVWALALLGPLFMYALLRFATGVPPLEAAMLESRGELFRDYQARVPVFFPIPLPRRSSEPSS